MTGTMRTCLGESQKGLHSLVKITAMKPLCMLPFSSEMFSQIRNEPLQTSVDCPMDHYRSSITVDLFSLSIFFSADKFACIILELEAFRQLEIKLDSCTLMLFAHCVRDGNINLNQVSS